MLKEEYESIAALTKEALECVQSARISLLNTHPFYGTLLTGMPLVPEFSWCPTAATDHRNIYFNPEFIMGMPEDRKKAVFKRVDADPTKNSQQKTEYKAYVEVFYRKKTMKEVVFILLHELRHVTNDHMSRAKAFNPNKYNIAADHGINTGLVLELRKWFPSGRQTTFTSSFEFMKYAYCDFKYTGMTSEDIYALLPDSEVATSSNGGAHIGETKADDDSILGYSNPQPTMSPVEKDEAMSHSRSLINTACKAAGDTAPQDIRDLVAKMGKPTINYLDLIKQRMVSRVKSDLSYRKPARRSGSVTQVLRNYGAISKRQSIILPGRKKTPTVDIVIGFDVSGSISPETLNRVFSEIIGLCNLYKCFRVTLFCWSTEVGDVKVYTNNNITEMLDYKVTSTGGTSATCAFKYIEEHIPKAKDVIIFTDGYIEDLSGRKNWAKAFSTLWVICDGRSGWEPPFGRAVDLDEQRNKRKV